MQDHFEKLIVWQKGIALVKEVYRLTKMFPKEEQYGLTSQMRRAAVSIPANIAEGKGRSHKKEYRQFLYIAQGSTFEMMTLTIVATELAYLTKEEIQNLQSLLSEITAMLRSLIRVLN